MSGYTEEKREDVVYYFDDRATITTTLDHSAL